MKVFRGPVGRPQTASSRQCPPAVSGDSGHKKALLCTAGEGTLDRLTEPR